MKVLEILITALPLFIIAFILYDGKFLSKHGRKMKTNKSLPLLASSVTDDESYLALMRIPAVAEIANNRQPNNGIPFEEEVYVNRIDRTLPPFIKVKNKLVEHKLNKNIV